MQPAARQTDSNDHERTERSHLVRPFGPVVEVDNPPKVELRSIQGLPAPGQPGESAVLHQREGMGEGGAQIEEPGRQCGVTGRDQERPSMRQQAVDGGVLRVHPGEAFEVEQGGGHLIQRVVFVAITRCQSSRCSGVETNQAGWRSCRE